MIQASLHNYNLDCFREGQRLNFSTSQTPLDPNQEGQQDGIRVVTGITGFIQKSLGYAEEIAVTVGGKSKMITVNKRSRNKWIARVGGTDKLSNEQHTAIQTALKNHQSDLSQSKILSNYAEAITDGRIVNPEFNNPKEIQKLFLQEKEIVKKSENPPTKRKQPPAAKREQPPATKTKQPPAAKREQPPATKTKQPPVITVDAPPIISSEEKQTEAAFSLDLLMGCYHKTALKAGLTNPGVNLAELAGFMQSLTTHYTKGSERNSFDIEKFNQDKEGLEKIAPYMALYFENLAMTYSDNPEQLLSQINDHILEVKTLENGLNIQISARKNFSKVLEQIRKHQYRTAEERKEADQKEALPAPIISQPTLGTKETDLQLIQSTLAQIAQAVSKNIEGSEISSTPFMDQWRGIQSAVTLSAQGLIAIEKILTQMDKDLSTPQRPLNPLSPQASKASPPKKRVLQNRTQLVRSTIEQIAKKVFSGESPEDSAQALELELGEIHQKAPFTLDELKLIKIGLVGALQIYTRPTAS